MSNGNRFNPEITPIELAQINYVNSSREEYEFQRGVDARWLLYGSAKDENDRPVDTETDIIDLVQDWFRPASTLGNVLDVGAAGGWFLRRLGQDFPTAKLYGLEPHRGQFRRANAMLTDIDNHLTQRIAEITRKDVLPPPAPQVTLLSTAIETTGWESMIGEARLSLFTAMFMLYHVKKEHRLSLYQKVGGMMLPNGLALCTTSGNQNKSSQREIELEISDILKVSAPPHMNAGFTSEIAVEELPQNFDFVYELRQQGTIGFRDQSGKLDQLNAGLFLMSLLSLLDQFGNGALANDPIKRDRFLEAATAVVDKKLMDPKFREYVARSTYVFGSATLSDEKQEVLYNRGFVAIKAA